jgi:hypothetical protein
MGKIVLGSKALRDGRRGWREYVPQASADDAADDQVDQEIPDHLWILAAPLHFNRGEEPPGERAQHEDDPIEPNVERTQGKTVDHE